MSKQSKSSVSSSEMATDSPQSTPPSGRIKGRHSRSSSREVTPEVTPRSSVHMMDTSELSPLKQFQRMKENGTIRLMPKSRRSTDGNQSDPCEAANSDKENKKYLRMSMTMNLQDVPSRRNSSVSVTGAADLNGAGPSLLKMSSEANIHVSRTSLHPADSSSNVSTCTEMSCSSTASSSVSKPSQSASNQNLHQGSRSKDPKDVLLAHLMGDPVYGTRPIMPVITAAEHPVSRRKPPLPRSSATLPLEKPVIEVKLVKNERPRSSYRMSKSAEELDKPEEENTKHSMFLRHAGSNLRNSFIDRNRDSICNSVNDVQTVLKPQPEYTEEEIYSLPQPQSYSEDTLKAVKKITDKYDTLQMRKLRALSFRENKGGNSDPNSPASPAVENTEKVPFPAEVTIRVESPEDSSDTTLEDLSDTTLDLSPDSVKEAPREPIQEMPRRKKPPLPPMPPPTSRISTGPTGRVVEVPPHLAVVDPDAAEDSAFMIEPRKQKPEPELIQNTEGDEVVCVSSGITQKDVSRIDLFFRSRECEVVVCQCLADMIMGTADPATGVVDMWSAVCHTGVPVLVLNSGLGKRRRELFVVLAERETGFPLWQDRVNYLTGYKDIKTAMHQLQPSNNLRMRIGFRFYCTNAAAEFLSKYREMTTDPNDDLWKVSNSRMDKGRRALLKKLRMKKRPSKGDISQPCNFAHVTKVDTKDYLHYESIQDLVPQSPINSGSSSKGSSSNFRPRLQTT